MQNAKCKIGWLPSGKDGSCRKFGNYENYKRCSLFFNPAAQAWLCSPKNNRRPPFRAACGLSIELANYFAAFFLSALFIRS